MRIHFHRLVALGMAVALAAEPTMAAMGNEQWAMGTSTRVARSALPVAPSLFGSQALAAQEVMNSHAKGEVPGRIRRQAKKLLQSEAPDPHPAKERDHYRAQIRQVLLNPNVPITPTDAARVAQCLANVTPQALRSASFLNLQEHEAERILNLEMLNEHSLIAAATKIIERASEYVNWLTTSQSSPDRAEKVLAAFWKNLFVPNTGVDYPYPEVAEPYTENDFAIPAERSGEPGIMRDRERLEYMSGTRLYHAENVRRIHILRDLRPWLDRGLTYPEIRDLAYGLVRYTKVNLQARPSLFRSGEIKTIVRNQPFNIDKLAARFLAEKQRYRGLRHGLNLAFTPQEIDELLFVRFMPAHYVELMCGDGYTRDKVLREARTALPEPLVNQIALLERRAAIREDLSLFMSPESARQTAKSFGEERWAIIQQAASRLITEASFERGEALQATVPHRQDALTRVAAVFLDAPLVNKVLSSNKGFHEAVRYLIQTPFPTIVADLKKHGRVPEKIVPNLREWRKSMHLGLGRKSRPPTEDHSHLPVVLESFDRTQGTWYEQFGKPASDPSSGLLPQAEMMRMAEELVALWHKNQDDAQVLIREWVQQNASTRLFLEKMIRPRPWRGVFEDDLLPLRNMIFQELLRHSFGTPPPDPIDVHQLPGTYRQVQELGHIIVKGVLDSQGMAQFRQEYFGKLPFPSSPYRLELISGIPIRIWVEAAGGAWDYLYSRNNETGEILTWSFDSPALREDESEDLVVDSETSGEGEISFGSKRPTLAGRTVQTVADLGDDHPYERVVALQKRNVVLACSSRQSSAKDEMSHIIDLRDDGRPVRSYPRIFPIDEFHSLQSYHRFKRHKASGGQLKLGNRVWFPIPNGERRLDIGPLVKATDGTTLILGAMDLEAREILPAQPLHPIYAVPADNPPDSFRKLGFVNVYERVCSRDYLKGLSNVIVETRLGSKTGSLDLFGFSSHFVFFKGALVEVRIVKGKKRFVRFLEDAKGNPILSATGLPVVMDLRSSHYNWPDLMSTEWVGPLKKASEEWAALQVKTSNPSQAEARLIFTGLSEALSSQQIQDVPQEFRKEYRAVLADTRAAAESPEAESSTVDFSHVLSEISIRIESIFKHFDQHFNQDVTPIPEPSEWTEDVSHPIEVRSAESPMPVAAVLEEGFVHVRRETDGMVPAPGYYLRQRSVGNDRLGIQIGLDKVLQPGQELLVTRRYPPPDIQRMKTAAGPGFYTHRQVMAAQQEWPPVPKKKIVAMMPGTPAVTRFRKALMAWKRFSPDSSTQNKLTKSLAHQTKLRDAVYRIATKIVPQQEMPYFTEVIEDTLDQLAASAKNPTGILLQLIDNREGIRRIWRNAFVAAHPEVFAYEPKQNRWGWRITERRQREILEKAYDAWMDGALETLRIAIEAAGNTLSPEVMRQILKDKIIELHGEYNRDVLDNGGWLAMTRHAGDLGKFARMRVPFRIWHETKGLGVVVSKGNRELYIKFAGKSEATAFSITKEYDKISILGVDSDEELETHKTQTVSSAGVSRPAAPRQRDRPKPKKFKAIDPVPLTDPEAKILLDWMTTNVSKNPIAVLVKRARLPPESAQKIWDAHTDLIQFINAPWVDAQFLEEACGASRRVSLLVEEVRKKLGRGLPIRDGHHLWRCCYDLGRIRIHIMVFFWRPLINRYREGKLGLPQSLISNRERFSRYSQTKNGSQKLTPAAAPMPQASSRIRPLPVVERAAVIDSFRTRAQRTFMETAERDMEIALRRILVDRASWPNRLQGFLDDFLKGVKIETDKNSPWEIGAVVGRVQSRALGIIRAAPDLNKKTIMVEFAANPKPMQIALKELQRISFAHALRRAPTKRSARNSRSIRKGA